MKKVLIVVWLVVANMMNAISQNSFIEVTVEDTVILKPIKISYLIITNPSNTTEALDLYRDEKKEELKRAPKNYLAEAEKKLKNNGFVYSKTTFDKFQLLEYNKLKNYKINNYDYEYDYDNKESEEGLIVELKSLEELDKLFSTLRDQKGIKGEIFNVVQESKDKYRESLIKKLYTKAQKEASILADLSGSKIGKLISAEEPTNNSYTIWDWYKEILSFGKFSDVVEVNLHQIYTCKFTFKFELTN